MSTCVAPIREVQVWTESLKKRIEELTKPSKGASKSDSFDHELRVQLIEALDLLMSLSATEGYDSQFSTGLTGDIANALDSALARWQAGIEAAFHQTATRELAAQLSSAESISGRLTEREEHLEGLRQQLEERVAENLKSQAELARQRKSVSRDLKRRKLELLAEIELSRSQLRCSVETEVRSELGAQLDEADRQRQESLKVIAELEQKYAAAQATTDAIAKQNDETQKRNIELNQQFCDAHAKAVELDQQLQSKSERCEQLSAEISEVRGLLSQQQATGPARDEQLVKLQQELDGARRKLRAAQEQCKQEESLKQFNARLEQQLAATIEELKLAGDKSQQSSKLAPQLEEVRAQNEQLRQQLVAAKEANDGSAELQAAIDSLQNERQQLHEQLEKSREEGSRLRAELDATNSDRSGSDEEELRQKLQNAESELEDLRSQNSDLASQLAHNQVSNSTASPDVNFNHESLTWEERKRLIMAQLENESMDATSQEAEAVSKNRIEIDKVLATTQKEIDRRDREIEELRSIVTQQSDAREGIAIGAAAVAQVIEADELIQQERQKLREIQKEWEEKLRKAEIDNSMERAKLARERLQLEVEIENMPKGQPSDQSAPNSTGGKTRKWLEHLGLKDDKQ